MATVGAIDVILRTNTRPATLAFEASSRSITKFERNAQRDLNRFGRHSTVAMTAAAKANNTLRASFVGLRGAMGFLGAGISIGAFTRLLDSSTRISNSLKVAGLAGADLTAVYDRLYASAQKNAAPLESLVDLYSRVSLVQNELGVSTEQLLGFTDNIALALRVSGKSASEASGALLQLSQALGSGVVRAEEFNSILEGALPIAQAAAAGLDEAGGSVSKLRQLVVEGKISSAAFFAAFEAGSETLRSKVADAELTVSQSFVRLQNVLVDVVGKFDGATGASSAAAEGIEALADSVQQLGDFIRDNQPAIAAFIGVLEGDFLEAIRRFREEIGLAAVVDPMMAGDVAQSAADIEAAIHRVIAAASGVTDPAGIDVIIEQLVAGDLEAGELQKALVSLGGTSINFAAVHDLAGLITQLRTARSEAAALATEIARPKGPQGRGGKRGASTEPGFKPISLADYPIAPGSGSSTKRSSEAAAIDRQRRATERLIQSLYDEQRAIHMNATEVRIMTALRSADIDASSEQGRQIANLIRKIETERTAVERLETQMESAKDLAQEVFTGLLDDLKSGVPLMDALGNALSAIGDKLINMAIDDAFDGLFSTGSQPGDKADGGFASIFDAVFQGSKEGSGEGVFGGFDSFLKNSGSSLGGVAGGGFAGFSIGQGTANPLMGALGGAASGFMMGGPVGAVVGGIAGQIGPLFGKPPANDNAPDKRKERAA